MSVTDPVGRAAAGWCSPRSFAGSVKRKSTVELHEVGQPAQRRRAPRDRERCAVAGRVLGRGEDCPQAAHVDEREFVEVDQNGLASSRSVAGARLTVGAPAKSSSPRKSTRILPSSLHLDHFQQGCSLLNAHARSGRRRRGRTRAATRGPLSRATSRGGERRRSGHPGYSSMSHAQPRAGERPSALTAGAPVDEDGRVGNDRDIAADGREPAAASPARPAATRLEVGPARGRKRRHRPAARVARRATRAAAADGRADARALELALEQGSGAAARPSRWNPERDVRAAAHIFVPKMEAHAERERAGKHPPTPQKFEPGDHVWYYPHPDPDVPRITADLDVPRDLWFPGSTGPDRLQGPRDGDQRVRDLRDRGQGGQAAHEGQARHHGVDQQQPRQPLRQQGRRRPVQGQGQLALLPDLPDLPGRLRRDPEVAARPTATTPRESWPR